MAYDGNLLPKYIMLQKALFASLRLKDVLNAAVLQFVDLCGGAKVAIFLSDNENLAFKLMASQGYSDLTLEQIRIVPFTAESLLKFVAQTRVPAHISHAKKTP